MYYTDLIKKKHDWSLVDIYADEAITGTQVTKREDFQRMISCMIKCGFCGGTLTRRNWHSSSAYTKTIWQCVTATKQGKKYCPHCKGIPEEVIEKAFVKSYQLLCSDQQQVVEEFLQKVEGVLNLSLIHI